MERKDLASSKNVSLPMMFEFSNECIAKNVCLDIQEELLCNLAPTSAHLVGGVRRWYIILLGEPLREDLHDKVTQYLGENGAQRTPDRLLVEFVKQIREERRDSDMERFKHG